MTPKGGTDPLNRIEAMVEIIYAAHASIFAQHRRVLDLDRDEARTRELLRESAHIVFQRAPAAAREARTIAQDHAIGEILNPKGTGDSAALDRAVRTAEATLSDLLRRQEAIADELAALIEQGPST